MNRRSRGRLAAIVSSLVVVVAVFAAGSAAADGASASCDGRPGTTVLKDTQARVFEHHAIYYACSRTTGRVHQLSGPKSWDDRGDGFELAGSYVAWAQDPSPLVSDLLELLDVDHGSAKTVFPGQEQGEATSSQVQTYLVNDQGTVVWLYDGRGGGVVNSKYYAFSEVLDSRSHRALGSVSSKGNDPQTPAITSLGLSSDGKFAFWLRNGKPHGAPVPK
jgi:hypothetical protein